MEKVTIKDVAREAGVSISTVSNALNNVDVLRPQTKAHILAVAERMHYIPNLNGRNLKAQTTRMIGMFVTYMGGPYMGALADGLAGECRARGYELNIFVTEQGATVMNNLLGHRVDGAVIVDSGISRTQENALAEAGIPIVYLNREKAGRLQTAVCFDSREAGRMAARYLVQKGKTRLGLVEGADNYDGRERARGFREELAAQGIPLSDRLVWQGDFSREKTFHTLSTYLAGWQERGAEALPQAVFAANDQSAIGCMEAFRQAGVQIPGQVGIMGCDDIELGRYMQPALTTIRTNFEEQGRCAAGKLAAMLEGEEGGEVVCLPCRMVERSSV